MPGPVPPPVSRAIVGWGWGREDLGEGRAQRQKWDSIWSQTGEGVSVCLGVRVSMHTSVRAFTCVCTYACVCASGWGSRMLLRSGDLGFAPGHGFFHISTDFFLPFALRHSLRPKAPLNIWGASNLLPATPPPPALPLPSSLTCKHACLSTWSSSAPLFPAVIAGRTQPPPYPPPAPEQLSTVGEKPHLAGGFHAKATTTDVRSAWQSFAVPVSSHSSILCTMPPG